MHFVYRENFAGLPTNCGDWYYPFMDSLYLLIFVFVVHVIKTNISLAAEIIRN
jgi:hypothetical protein